MRLLRYHRRVPERPRLLPAGHGLHDTCPLRPLKVEPDLAAETAKLAAAIEAIYCKRDNHILPFVGTGFERPTQDHLRVAVVGINSYVSEKEWHKINPAWFAGWFEHSSHRFYKGAKKHAMALASALTERADWLRGQKVVWPDSFYATNAIKTYLPEAEGKRADQVSPELFDQHAATWRNELDAMAEHGALPHLIVIFGEPFWAHAWSAFKPPHADGYKHLRVLDYRHTDGPSLHFVNRLRLGGANGEQTTLLVRLRHPSSRTKKGSVSWLLGQGDFWTLAKE